MNSGSSLMWLLGVVTIKSPVAMVTTSEQGDWSESRFNGPQLTARCKQTVRLRLQVRISLMIHLDSRKVVGSNPGVGIFSP